MKAALLVGASKLVLPNGWELVALVDEDAHLNIYVENDDKSDIVEVDTGQGDGVGEQLAIRLSTGAIEDEYASGSEGREFHTFREKRKKQRRGK